MIKAYTKYVAEGKLMAYVAIFVALVLRLPYMFSPVETSLVSNSYLWQYGDPFLSNRYVSVLVGSLSVACIAILLMLICKSHAIIRQRTYLPFFFGLLFLSYDSRLIPMNSDYIGLIFLLFALHILFSTYRNKTPQRLVFDATSLLVIGSFFVTDLLFFIPLFMIGFTMMNSFNFKAFLAALLSIGMFYGLASFYFIATDNWHGFYSPFIYYTVGRIPLLSMTLNDLICTGSIFLLLMVIMINNSMNSYKDKIRTRNYISFLNLLTIVSFLISFLSPISSNIFWFVGLTSGSLIFAHFFALATSRWKIIIFYLLFVIYLVLPCRNYILYHT